MTPSTQRLFASHAAAGHALLRLTLGVALLMHGLVRLKAGPGAFADEVGRQFAEKGSMLPTAMVRGFGYAVPGVEAALGGLLVLGLFSLAALVGSGLWVAALVLGSCSIQDWSAVGTQMTYAVVIAVLVAGQPCDQWSVDGLLRGAFGRR